MNSAHTRANRLAPRDATAANAARAGTRARSSPGRPRSPRATGFTLIELLVAITLMAIVSVISWRGLDAIARVRDALEQRAEQTDALLRLLGQLERDLVLRAPDMVLAPAFNPQLPPSPGPTSSSDPSPPAANPAAHALATTLPLAVAVERLGRNAGSRLELIRSGPYEPGTWQRVEWWLDNGRLLRAAGTPSATYPLPAPTLDETAVLLDGVNRFEILGWVRNLGWQELPRPADATTPVDGLQVVIARDAGDQNEIYRRIISFQ